ncbi:heparinase II/III family protein [Sutcliffiella horikoshii]|uniref:alginate lyase family protein n=1 Tax=Sutcliffiella horikoshii TaxID=79883 RepID=UPI00384C2A93
MIKGELSSLNIDSEEIKSLIYMLPKSRNKDYMFSAKLILQESKFMLPPFGTTYYPNGILWNEDNKSRGYLRLIHGHTFIGCLLDAFEFTKETSYLTKSMEIIQDWINKNQYSETSESMAYHDETTAIRLQAWLRLLIVGRQALPEQFLSDLFEQVKFTAQLLRSDDFHSTNTNHGMFQDISLLIYSLLFKNQIEAEEYKNIAVSRLKEYFNFVFTSEGVHKEHSPSYHMLVASNIKKLALWLGDLDNNIAKDFMVIYNKSEDFAINIIRPDGTFPPTCDTESKLVKSSSYKNLYSSQGYEYAVYSGKKGTAPNETDKVFKNSGYAIFRDDWLKKEKGTYVLFTAAYNADYHKHSDDLNLTIFSGEEIITEAGPNGYNYKDPFTKYAYSSFAHNTLIVDGAGLPRTDGNYDKVKLIDYSITKSEVEATGVNLRYQGVKHKRNVNYKKTKQIVTVCDHVLSNDRHKYQFLWHVAPGMNVERKTENSFEILKEGKRKMEVSFTSDSSKIKVRTMSGQTKPKVSGWRFPLMETKQPSTTIEITLDGQTIDFKTTFKILDESNDNLIETIQKEEGKSEVEPNRKFELRKVDIQLKNSNLEINCNAIGEGLKYAFYIYKDNEIIEKIHYQADSKLIYKLNDAGTYKARVYVKEKQEEIIRKNTKEVNYKL